MGTIKVGDIVARKSYGQDMLFKVVKLVRSEGKTIALLRGMEFRLYADADLTDLVKKNSAEIERYKKGFDRKNEKMLRSIYERREVESQRNERRAMQVDESLKRSVKSDNNLKRAMMLEGNLNRSSESLGSLDRAKKYKKKLNAETFELPGKVLHIDGDKEYLDLCMETYSQLKIKAKGIHAPESKHPEIVSTYLPRINPDILVITGHDGLYNNKRNLGDINNYRHSKYFVEAVRRARNFEQGKDDLIIFAGACQSYYEALIDAGANFASSPHRIMIHAYDPIFIVEKLAYSSIYDVIPVKEIIDNTITGIEGVGGVDTRGRLRIGYPRSPYINAKNSLQRENQSPEF